MELPLERVRIRLRFTRPVRFHFLHGGAWHGAFKRALAAAELPAGLVPFIGESGRTEYPPGERYHLGLTLVGSARSSLEPLARGLARLGRDAPVDGGRAPTLGGNFEVEGLDRLSRPELEEEMAALAAAGALSIRFLSPLRVRNPPELREHDGAFLGTRGFSLGVFLARIESRVRELAAAAGVSWPGPLGGAPAAPAQSPLDAGSLWWIDLPLQGKTLGGVVGEVRSGPLPPEWLPFLALAQHLHVGKGAHYGLGACLIGGSGYAPARLFGPARTALARTAEPGLLEASLDHLLTRSETAGIDRLSPEAFSAERDRHIEALSHELGSGAYRAQPLLGLLLPREARAPRALAVPTVRDRVAQRSAARVLDSAVQALLEDCSFAYRKGFSRAGAAAAIQRAFAEGYRYVLDADIAAFFDSVPWERLEAKLRALFPLEPLVRLLGEWVRAPVVFDGRELARHGGLPQGAPVSPLLANLYLDELDEELLDQGFRLVRYADDFVVLSKDLDGALRAREAASRALAKLGLELHEGKTQVRSFDEGFGYLGYLFVRSLRLEESRRSPEESVASELETIPKGSWLAQVPFERLRELARAPEAEGPAAPIELVPLAPSRRPAASGLAIYVCDVESRLRLSGDRLLVERSTEPARSLPVRGVSHLVLLGPTRVSLALMSRLADLGVPTLVCRRSGELRATFSAHDPDWPLWMAQARFASDPAACLAFAARLVQTRLHNCATRAVSLKWEGCHELARRLRELEAEAARAPDAGALRGIEGRGAALYFGALAASLPAEWGFRARARRPPPDPVNAMLSFGHALLHTALSTALQAAGLQPRIGFYHRERGRHHALASDLQEEWRFLIEALVWTRIRRREVRLRDFSRGDDGGLGCRLGEEPRRRFVEALEQRLETELTLPGLERSTYRRLLWLQARSVRDLIEGRRDRHLSLRLHA